MGRSNHGTELCRYRRAGLRGGPIEHLLLKDIGSIEEYLRVVREDGLTVKRQLGNLEQ